MLAAAVGAFAITVTERAANADARTELNRLAPTLKARPLADLTPASAIALDGGEHVVHFQQHHRGLPVIGHGATVRLDASGRGTAIRNNLASHLPSTVSPTLDAAAATRAAQLQLPVGKFSVAKEGARLVLFAPVANLEARLVWHFEPRIPGLPFAPEIMIDANSGELVLARDRVRSLAPEARVYASNPSRSPGLVLSPFAIEPATPAAGAQPHLEADRIEARTCVDKGSLTNYPGTTTPVHVCDLDAIARPDGNGNYVDPPDDNPKDSARNEDPFSEISMFHHLGWIYAHFEALAPPGTTKIVKADQFSAVANLRVAPGLFGGDQSHLADPKTPLTTYSNAFFAPGTQTFGELYGVKDGGLWFGQGDNRDYAYDGDVVYHEFTHAVIDHTMGLDQFAFDSQGLSVAPGAINEALADFFSSTLSGDPDVGEYAAGDVSATLPYVRTVANDERCGPRTSGEVHFDSPSVSGALWSARQTLSPLERVIFDRTVYGVLLANPQQTAATYREFWDFVLTEFDRRSSLGARAIRAELATRGYEPDCDRTLDATERVTGPSDNLGHIAFQSPGTLDTGVASVPGVVTFRSPVTGSQLIVDFGAVATANALSGLPTDTGAYVPTVLASFDTPLRFNGISSNASVKVAAASDSAKHWVAHLAAPPGAKMVYVQIANNSPTSGIYDNVKIGADPTDSPVSTASADAGDGSGCATSPAAPRTDVGALAVALGAALSFGVRRRRARRRVQPSSAT